jgi:hypothetical protein
MALRAVSEPDSGGRRRLLPRPLGWLVCLALALALGCLCCYPLGWTYLTGWAVAWKAGWAGIDPTLVDDGVAVFFVFTGILWLLFALVAVPINVLARRWTGLSRRQWWWTSVTLWVAPFAVFVLPTMLH